MPALDLVRALHPAKCWFGQLRAWKALLRACREAGRGVCVLGVLLCMLLGKRMSMQLKNRCRDTGGGSRMNDT